MRHHIIVLSAVLLFASPAFAADLSPQMAPLSFLLGTWDGTGKSEHGTNRGMSIMTPEVGGAAILRRDHTDVTAPDGKLAESFDQIMLIYPEGGAVHADYFDGTHTIHYTSAVIDAGKSVQFLTAAQSGAPVFRLTYAVKAANTLSVKFELEPPGQAAFQTVAEGDIVKR